MTREVEPSVQSNVAGADEEGQSRNANQPERNRGTIVKQLEADQRVQQQDPAGRRDRGNMNSRKALIPSSQLECNLPQPPMPTFSTPSRSGMPPTVKISHISMMTKPSRNN